jgi:hypothetical protein
MDQPTCATCPFWEPDTNERPPLIGWCHRHAPRFVAEIQARHDAHEGLDDLAFSFPKTLAGDWCGEHPDFPAYLASRAEKFARPS